MKFFALFVIAALAVTAAAQNQRLSLETIELSYQTPTFSKEWQEKNTSFFGHKITQYRRSYFDLDSWNWQYARQHDNAYPHEFLRRGYTYQPDLSFRIGDGLFGGSVIHGTSWTGRTEPRYIQLKFMGIIPIGRARVNGGW